MIFIAQPYTDHFAQPFLKHLDCEVLITSDIDLIHESMQHHDWAWVEWSNRLCKQILDKPSPCKVMVRTHDYELRSGIINQINYSNADLLWFTNSDSLEEFERILPNVKADRFLLPNAVDETEFEETITENKHIVAISVNNQPRKKYDRLIETYLRVLQKDDQWKLTIMCDFSADQRQFEKLQRITSGLNVEYINRVFPLESILDKGGINNLFKDKSIVISSSSHETFHYSVAEGALCGCKPVVYNWEWGPAKDLWNGYVCDSIDEMAQAIIDYKPSKEYRKYVIENFGAKKLTNQLMQHIT